MQSQRPLPLPHMCLLMYARDHGGEQGGWRWRWGVCQFWGRQGAAAAWLPFELAQGVQVVGGLAVKSHDLGEF